MSTYTFKSMKYKHIYARIRIKNAHLRVLYARVDIVDRKEIMREAVFERKLKKRIEEKGGLCLKWVSPGYTGVPDRIVLLPGGRILFVEVKRPGTKDGRTPRQKRVADLLTALGFTVIRMSSMDDIEEALT